MIDLVSYLVSYLVDFKEMIDLVSYLVGLLKKNDTNLLINYSTIGRSYPLSRIM